MPKRVQGKHFIFCLSDMQEDAGEGVFILQLLVCTL